MARNFYRFMGLAGLVGIILGGCPLRAVAQWQAAGAPIADCNNAGERLTRLSSGLPVQEEAMRRQQAMIDAIKAERSAGTKEAKEALRERAAETVTSSAADELKQYLLLREKVQQLPPAGTPAAAAARMAWMKGVSELQETVHIMTSLAGAGKAGWEYGREIQSRAHSMQEHLLALDKLAVDSGIAEEAGGMLAEAGGPVTMVVFTGSLFLLDHAMSEYQDAELFDQQRQLENQLDIMRSKYHDVQDKMTELQACQQTVAKQEKPPEPPTAAKPALPAPAPAPEAAAGGGHGGALLIGAVVAGGGALAAGAALRQMQQNQSGGGSCTVPVHCNALAPGPAGCTSGSAFSSALARYCSCMHFNSGYNLGAGVTCP